MHIFRVSNASQWNIGCVRSLALGLCVGHVHFIFFVLISFALGSAPDARIFALPNAKYTNVLVYFALVDAHFSRFKCKPVEYRLR